MRRGKKHHLGSAVNHGLERKRPARGLAPAPEFRKDLAQAARRGVAAAQVERGRRDVRMAYEQPRQFNPGVARGPDNGRSRLSSTLPAHYNSSRIRRKPLDALSMGFVLMMPLQGTRPADKL